MKLKIKLAIKQTLNYSISWENVIPPQPVSTYYTVFYEYLRANYYKTCWACKNAENVKSELNYYYPL